MALKVSNDLERMGDYATSIAKRVKRISVQQQLKPMITIPLMADICKGMLKDVLDAYIERDDAKALDVWHRDAEVDEHYNQLFRELLTYILEDPKLTSACVDLMFVAKNLERIGDHATNIAEKIHYMVHGEELHRPRSDAP
jgi:phosphate transport system protein